MDTEEPKLITSLRAAGNKGLTLVEMVRLAPAKDLQNALAKLETCCMVQRERLHNGEVRWFSI